METRYFGAIFLEEAEVREAAVAASQKGFEIHDIHSPYPLHGIEEIPAFSSSRLAWAGGIAGLMGFAGMLLFVYWTSTVDWPLIVGGKPMNSWPAFVPVMFEVMVLFTGITAVIALLTVSGLWPGRKQPVLKEALDDNFILILKEENGAFDQSEAESLMKLYGAVKIWEHSDIKES